MDNKTKRLYGAIAVKIYCVALAVLLVSNGYLLYRVDNAEGIVHAFESSNEEPKAKDKPVFVTAQKDHRRDSSYFSYTVRLSDVESFVWSKAVPKTASSVGERETFMAHNPFDQWRLLMRKAVVGSWDSERFSASNTPDYLYVRDKTEIEKIDKYLGKKKDK